MSKLRLRLHKATNQIEWKFFGMEINLMRFQLNYLFLVITDVISKAFRSHRALFIKWNILKKHEMLWWRLMCLLADIFIGPWSGKSAEVSCGVCQRSYQNLHINGSVCNDLCLISVFSYLLCLFLSICLSALFVCLLVFCLSLLAG